MSMIQQHFIRRILTEEARRLKRNQGNAINNLLRRRTGRLINDRQFTVSDSGSFGGKLTMSIPIYGRFLDIKRTHLTKTGTKKNTAYPIYNRYVFGHYTSIADQLMYGLTEDIVTDIKRGLKLKK